MKPQGNLRENSQSKTFSFNRERTLPLPAHHHHHRRHHHRRPEGGRTSHRLRRTEGVTHRCCSARPPPRSGRRRCRAPTARSGTPYRPARPPGWPPRFDHWPSARRRTQRHTQHTHIKPHINFGIFHQQLMFFRALRRSGFQLFLSHDHRRGQCESVKKNEDEAPPV